MDLAYAKSQLQLWYKAQAAVSINQTYSIEGRTFTRAHIKDILTMINYWQGQIKALESGRPANHIRVKRIVPRDD